jgi:hypothetical protein
MRKKNFVLREQTRVKFSENWSMGELIAFKPASGVRLRAAPVNRGTVIVFAGLWQERPKDNESKAKRARQRSRRRSRQTAGKSGPQEQSNTRI